ncbi:hypothetical protein SMKC081_23150 [Serratia marcescens]|nr:hypothetical protein SMKC081_23150 [Serratia marcescens]
MQDRNIRMEMNSALYSSDPYENIHEIGYWLRVRVRYEMHEYIVLFYNPLFYLWYFKNYRFKEKPALTL